MTSFRRICWGMSCVGWERKEETDWVVEGHGGGEREDGGHSPRTPEATELRLSVFWRDGR